MWIKRVRKNMDCPNGIRECPNGWTDCNLCAYFEMCKAGLYYGEPEETDSELLEQAAEVSERVMQAEAMESAQFIKKGTASTYSGLKRFYSLKTPDLHHKDPLPLDGGSLHGRGSKSKNHKKPLKKTPEYMKFLGM